MVFSFKMIYFNLKCFNSISFHSPSAISSRSPVWENLTQCIFNAIHVFFHNKELNIFSFSLYLYIDMYNIILFKWDVIGVM